MLALRVWSLDQDNRHRKSLKSSNKGMKWMDRSDSDVEKGLRRGKVETVVEVMGRGKSPMKRLWRPGLRYGRRGGQE